MRFSKIYFLVAIFGIIPLFSYSQESGTTAEAVNDRVNGVDERLTEAQNDLSILKKIKISGYLQVQFEKTENAKGLFVSPYDNSENVLSRIRIRRSRLKFNYVDTWGQMVVQGDFSNEKFELKDAFLDIKEPWLDMLTLRAGVFNRPNFEVEYSSSQRESPERSNVIRALYPNERDLGAMLIAEPYDLFKLQFAAFNNTYRGAYSQFGPNFRDEPLYFMGRLTKSIDFTQQGIGVDFGVHGRYGNIVAKQNYIAESDVAVKSKYKTYTSDSTSLLSLANSEIGGKVSRGWFGVEAQVYWDFLGGMKLMGEYIMGTDVGDPADTISIESRKINGTDTSLIYSKNNKILRKRSFDGWYVMLVKNITKDWQAAIKYDSYRPNTELDPENALSEKDLPLNTLGFGIHNYSFNNVRITLWYDINSIQTSNSVTGKNNDGTDKTLMPVDLPKNLLTFRIQYKF